ncbi:F-actin-monooxygenase MICAL3 [Patella vulgata]|uniref:F-actin-monooxygenase MICAL3 n=1 Tax=Patella vulgata TaxID=6465 RepID=UPI00217FBF57|nr:F-actin-monooxygenase MICAL3 [Patella vulgata]
MEQKETLNPEEANLSTCFDKFVRCESLKDTIRLFKILSGLIDVDLKDNRNVYSNIKNKVNTWRARALWEKLDLRVSQQIYEDKAACTNLKALIIGAGPCGLRSAIEIALMGGKAVVVERREDITRNNVLSLWPFVVQDLKSLGAKDFFPGFCVGGKDHISIRKLQCILVKTALLLGVEVHINVAFNDLIEPPEDQTTGTGWRCKTEPEDHTVCQYEFNTVIGADGKRYGLKGFKRKEFRGKLAIAITANFVNKRTKCDALVPEICGLSYLYDQAFFNDLKNKTDIDLENIVYFKGETHYFVFTAKKESLLRKGVLKETFSDPNILLQKENVDHDKLLAYAKETANESTQCKLPDLEFQPNKDGEPDVAMFDFTCLCTAEYSSRVVERKGHMLLAAIVGDSLLEPFWPSGTGAAHGFLGVMDTAWMIKQWYSGQFTPLEVLAERETIYQLLPQCFVKSLYNNHLQYNIDPTSRYVNLHTKARLKPSVVSHQYDGETNDLSSKILPSNLQADT